MATLIDGNIIDDKVIDGKAFSKELRAKLTHQVTDIKKHHKITPGLAVILVGEDPASEVYVNNKEKSAHSCGFHSVAYKLEETISEAALLTLIEELNEDQTIHGILVQLPLPPHISKGAVLRHIDPLKDVDGFHPINIGKLAIGKPALIPCTPLGCLLLIQDKLGKDLRGKNAVVVGASNIVGRPMAELLLAEDCTVTICHSYTKNTKAICQTADILVVATGVPHLVKGDWIKEGATVIDVGITRVPTDDGKTKLIGDVDFNAAKEKAAFITPVPGGVGPMTIACLLQNTLTALCLQLEIPNPNQ